MKIVSFSPSTPESLETDDYVPITARFEGDFQFPPSYWRTGDFKKTLIEFGVDRASGSICKVTATCLNRPVTSDRQRIDFGGFREGLPQTDISFWNNKIRIDTPQSIATSLNDDQLVIWFGEIERATEDSVRCGRVAFLIDEESVLCGIGFEGLSPQQIKNLLTATGSQ